MKSSWIIQLLRTTLFSVALCLLSVPSHAQQVTEPGFGAPKVRPLPKSGPTPRTKDGHPDLSGVYFPGRLGTFALSATIDDSQKQFDPKVTPEAKPPFQPWAAAKIKSMSEIDIQLGRASVNCLPRGVPGMFLTNPYPIQLVQTPGQLVQLTELNNNFRVIPTDGRPHSKDPDPGFNGEGVGHWDGDTLVIDVIAMDERTWDNGNGWFHSDQQHVVEHLTRPNSNDLVYQVTIEDPKVLTKPWTSAPRHWALAHEPLMEYYCTNDEDKRQLEDLESRVAHEKNNKQE